MESDKTPVTVVAGEASESDDDEYIEATSVETHVVEVSTKKAETAGVIISGEASESEEEEELNNDVTASASIPPLNVNPSEGGDRADITSTESTSPALQQQKSAKPKYNSLLNRKLRERNIAVRRHIVDTVHQTYAIAGKDLHNITLQLQKTQIAIQGVSHLLRNTTNDLFHLEDKVDIIQSCNILPDINIQLPTGSTLPTA